MPRSISRRISSTIPSSSLDFRRAVIFLRRSSRLMSTPTTRESILGTSALSMGCSPLNVSISIALMARCAVSTSVVLCILEPFCRFNCSSMAVSSERDFPSSRCLNSLFSGTEAR